MRMFLECINSELSINKKLQNLLDLCKCPKIKVQYHANYLALSTNATVPEVLLDSEIEDDRIDYRANNTYIL